MNKKHSKTLSAVFFEPVQSIIPWKDIENMLKALGAEVTDQGALKSLRRFLRNAGVNHDEI